LTHARVAFAGTPDFAVPTLEALAGSGYELVGVLTQPDRPKGRGREMASSSVRRVAERLRLPLCQPRSLRAAEDRRALAQWHADVLVVVAYGLLLPPEVLRLPVRGCINVHASLLPRWRGAAPVQRAILAGDTETGISIMQMDAGLDSGPVLLQRRTPIEPDETAGALLTRLAQQGAQALIEALPSVLSGRANASPQPVEGVTYAHKLEKADAPIDWRAPAIEVARAIRGLDPWPMAETSLREEIVKLRGARVVEERGPARPGYVRGLRDQALVVECGQGAVAIREWQRPGRRWLRAAEFGNGVAIIDTTLGSARG